MKGKSNERSVNRIVCEWFFANVSKSPIPQDGSDQGMVEALMTTLVKITLEPLTEEHIPCFVDSDVLPAKYGITNQSVVVWTLSIARIIERSLLFATWADTWSERL